MTYGAEIKTVNKLIKFGDDDGENDDVGIEIIDFDNGSAYDTNTANMQWKMWYVTKKDGTCWQSEEEKNSTNVEDMLVYENKEDIPEGNKIVGAYFESQYGGQLEGERSSIYIRFKIQDNAKVGKVYSFVQNDILWRDEWLDRGVYTVTNKNKKMPQSSENTGDYPNATVILKNQGYKKTTFNKYRRAYKQEYRCMEFRYMCKSN